MAALLLLLYATIFTLSCSLAKKHDLPATRIAGYTVVILVLAILAIAHRHNSFMAVFPALWLLCSVLLFRSRPASFGKRAATFGVSVAVLLVTMFASVVINKSITQQHVPSMLSLVVYDLTGIAVDRGDVFFGYEDPESPIPIIFRDGEPTLETLREHYNHRDWVPLYAIFDLGNAESSEDQRLIVKYWLRSIAKYPVAYLKHRIGVFVAILRLRDRQHGGLYVIPLTESRYGEIDETARFINHDYRLSWWQETTVAKGAQILNKTWLTVPAVYLLFLLVFLAYEVATRRHRIGVLFFFLISTNPPQAHSVSHHRA